MLTFCNWFPNPISNLSGQARVLRQHIPFGTNRFLRGSHQIGVRNENFTTIENTKCKNKMLELLTSPEAWGALATLVFLEIILGIDNVIFISIVANRLPEQTRTKAWRTGLVLALVIRILMLLTITWIMEFNKPLFNIFQWSFSVRDLILGVGGIFLIYKSTVEISQNTHPGQGKMEKPKRSSFFQVIFQIVMIDFVFSFDSILTAIGLSEVVVIMVAAVLIAILVMMIFLGSISDYIKRNPTMEVLALGFLILIGFILLIEAFHYQIPKGYIYFAVAFSFTIELINIRKRRRRGSVAENIALAPAYLNAVQEEVKGINRSI
jgi:predicted tellurium resistance membrane protein TerC